MTKRHVPPDHHKKGDVKRGTQLAPLRPMLQCSFVDRDTVSSMEEKTGRFPRIYENGVSPMTSGIKTEFIFLFSQ